MKFLITIVVAACFISCAKPSIEDLILKFDKGDSFDAFLAETGIEKYTFEQTPNIHADQISGRYLLPEGEFVYISAVRGQNDKFVLDSKPWILTGY